MVKSSDESEFAGDEFGPDGGYVPRILFFDDAGQHMKDIVQREDKYKASSVKWPHIFAQWLLQMCSEVKALNREMMISICEQAHAT